MARAYYVAERRLLSIHIRACPTPFMTSYDDLSLWLESTLAPAFLIIHGIGLGPGLGPGPGLGLVNTQSTLPLKLSYLVLPYPLTSD